VFDYATWSHYMRTARDSRRKEVFRVLSIQLTSVKQKNWAQVKAAIEGQGAGFNDKAYFDVWLMPQALRTADPKENVVIPLTEMPHSALRHLFETPMWELHWSKMSQMFKSRGSDAEEVPIYWCHTAEEDVEFDLHRGNTEDYGLLCSDVFTV
jgi:hypothetical protein